MIDQQTTARLEAFIARFKTPSKKEAIWQLTITIAPFIGLLLGSRLLIWLGLGWWTLPVCLLNALFQVRLFALFHDCGHNSLFPGRNDNDLWGRILAVLCSTPFGIWTIEHAAHHKTSGDLDKRGFGDVWTLTKEEFLKMPFAQKAKYWLFRNPLILFIFGPALAFLVFQRRSSDKWARTNSKTRHSIRETNIALAVVFLTLGLLLGFVEFWLLVYLPIAIVSSSIGVWLFYVQHQFPDSYWRRSTTGEWNETEAALFGSSYYKLPWWLNWFTANIGFHHIHHLNSGIPSYRLPDCHKALMENEEFSEILSKVKPLTLLSSLNCAFLRFYDELGIRKMIRLSYSWFWS